MLWKRFTFTFRSNNIFLSHCSFWRLSKTFMSLSVTNDLLELCIQNLVRIWVINILTRCKLHVNMKSIFTNIITVRNFAVQSEKPIQNMYISNNVLTNVKRTSVILLIDTLDCKSMRMWRYIWNSCVQTPRNPVCYLYQVYVYFKKKRVPHKYTGLLFIF